MSIMVYHGSYCPVEKPVAGYGRADLDFGQGFYVTNLRSQAERWAAIVSGIYAERHPMLNIYELDIEYVYKTYRCIHFTAYNQEWIDFIVHSRRGLAPWHDYDFVEGGIANDRVVDTVENYIAGMMPAEMALERLSRHQPNNQMCLLSQQLIDECLHYVDCEAIEENGTKQQKGDTPC